MTAVLFENVEKRFDGGVTALKSLTLEAPEQKFVALLGPSGCGKTTALRILAGLEMPTSGRVLIGGRDVTRLQPRDRDLAMVFQSYALYPHMTIRDNIAYPLWLREVPDAERKAKVEAVARSLEVEHLLERKPRQLSGGQRQRIALARAIVRDPAAFLMDEPLSNLDARLRLAMRGEIKRLCQRLGTTTIYVTHDQAEAMTMADLVAVMGSGVLQQLAPPEEVYDRPGQPLRRHLRRQPADERAEGQRRRGRVCSCMAAASPFRPRRQAELAARWRRRTRHQAGGHSHRRARTRRVPCRVKSMWWSPWAARPSSTSWSAANGCRRAPAKGFRAAIGSTVGVSFDIGDACFFDASGVTVVHRAQNQGGKQ